MQVLNGMPDLEIEKESLASSAKFSKKKEKVNSLEQENKNKRRENMKIKREEEKGS